MVDTLGETLSQIKNAESVGKKACVIKKGSRLIREVLSVMYKEGYIGEFETIDDGRGGVIKLELIGKVNKTGVIKPRFSTSKNGYEKFEKRYLPAKNFGILIVTTTKGIMTHNQAKKLGLGSQMLAYVY